MITQKFGTSVEELHELCKRWRLRPLLSSIAIILILTLFPFKFYVHATAFRRTHFFLLWLNTQPSTFTDFLENILLFMPFGFGLSIWLNKKGQHLISTFLEAFMAGALLSFTVEFLQLFLPTRSSSWGDVISNAIGSALGVLVFKNGGDVILRYASAMESKVEQVLTTQRKIVGFAVLAGLMLLCSAELQGWANLASWSARDTVFVGNDFLYRHPFQGRIVRIDVANRALSPGYFRSVGAMTRNGVSRRIKRIRPMTGDTASVKAETRPSNRSTIAAVSSLTFVRKGTETLKRVPIASGFQTARIVRAIRRSNQFTLRVSCIPGNTAAGKDGTIVSFASGPGHDDLFLGEQGRDIILSLRTVLMGKGKYWTLRIPNLFVKDQPRDIVATYNGSRLSVTADGESKSVVLDPGAILVRSFKGLANANAPGYAAVYEACFFVPLGFLLAFVLNRPFRMPGLRMLVLGVGVLAPPFLMEAILCSVSGRSFGFGNVAFGIGILALSFLLMSADWFRVVEV